MRFSAARGKQVALRHARPGALRDERDPDVEIVIDGLPSFAIEGREPLLAALASHIEEAGLRPCRRERQGDELRDPQSGGIEEFDDADEPERSGIALALPKLRTGS